jgi:hypothetical protein
VQAGLPPSMGCYRTDNTITTSSTGKIQSNEKYYKDQLKEATFCRQYSTNGLDMYSIPYTINSLPTDSIHVFYSRTQSQ